MKNVNKDPVKGKLGKVYMPDQQVCTEFVFGTIIKVDIAFDMVT